MAVIASTILRKFQRCRRREEEEEKREGGKVFNVYVFGLIRLLGWINNCRAKEMYTATNIISRYAATVKEKQHSVGSSHERSPKPMKLIENLIHSRWSMVGSFLP